MNSAKKGSSPFQVQNVYAAAYPARMQAFIEAGRQAGLAPASEDREEIALILVDYQHDFVDPTGTLAVPGAQDDLARLLTWFYENAHSITKIYVSMDTHLPDHIFYSTWWMNPQTGAHPQPFTEITEEDILNEAWVPTSPRDVDWSLYYTRQLKQSAKKNLMIWPYHTMQGTLGHMLSAPLSEALAWYSAARNTRPHYIIKGQTRRTEYYGIFGAEIPDPEDPTSSLNRELVEVMKEHDRIYVAGEAKSHCVLESEKQLVSSFEKRYEFLSKLYFLQDCTSSIKSPTIDFEAETQKELEQMQQQGVKMVRTTEVTL